MGYDRHAMQQIEKWGQPVAFYGFLLNLPAEIGSATTANNWARPLVNKAFMRYSMATGVGACLTMPSRRMPYGKSVNTAFGHEAIGGQR
jgi:hypothetical protein